MAGRGCFRQIAARLTEGVTLPEPVLEERLAVMKEHIELICSLKGESVGMREARKHTAWYLKGLRGAAAFRGRMRQAEYA